MHSTKPFFTILLCLLAMLTALPGSTIIKVVAWNIEWFPGQSFYPVPAQAAQRHVGIVQRQIQAMNPDVLLACEIRNWKYFEQAVARVPDLKVANVSHFVDNEFGVLWRQQLAIASKLPVVAAWAEAWQPTIASLGRGFSFAAIEVPGSDGEVILFYSIHLKSNRASNEQQTLTNYRLRDESIVQLLEHINRMERLMWKGKIAGIVVGGDFNTNNDFTRDNKRKFDDTVVQQLVAAGFVNTWANTPERARNTWRGSDQFEPTTFDYIFVKGERLSFGDAEMIQVPAEASDHHAVKLEITLD